MFRKILIANRGEIACRVAATARRLGIETVAVYSDADARARHVDACDEAHRVGPAPARESYLNLEHVLAAARHAGAEAIHPGYGFLSENEGFARAIADAGMVFIGPPPDAIAAMGSKSAAKALMEKAGVPLVPGYHGDEQAPEFLRGQADAIGYPVLIKASAGGGGKGMRIVERSEDFEAALASCKRESSASFGDDRVLIERYVRRPRHIEIQVFADSHGNCVSLFERDCSVQRRHQKVIEEAPAPGMDPARRQAMGEAAWPPRAVGYVGAGTVEFIADPDGNFFFMEMNTRLQVEHPVTEMITGFDLVEWQLRVAAGEPLPAQAADLGIGGHSIEARIYAENPNKSFLPSTGTIAHLRTPVAAEFCGQGSPARADGARDAQPATVRIDAGVREGDTITPYYDPMIAKLIVWGEDRSQAIARMAQALAEFEVVGPATNVDFLRRLMENPDFVAGHPDTGLIERDSAQLVPAATAPAAATLAIAAAAVLVAESTGDAQAHARARSGWLDPWSRRSGWRVGGGWRRTLEFEHPAGPQKVVLEYAPGAGGSACSVHAAGESIAVSALHHDVAGRRLRGLVGEHAFDVGLVVADEQVHLFGPDGHLQLGYASPLAHAGDDAADAGRLTAPMPGKVIALMVERGAKVRRGQPLAVMEAMKMEHTIAAPEDGEVREIFYAVGDQVDEGAQLIDIAAGGV
ncbi:MAG: acetyl/propionyl/methylcrotonyl-CoA carboxylase subunit alpha [Burkholderiaceae bacterium]